MKLNTKRVTQATDAETDSHSIISEPQKFSLTRSRNSNTGKTIVTKRLTSSKLTTVAPNF